MGQPRYQNDGHPVTSGPGFNVTTHPEALALPYRWRIPRLVFVNSMSDLFHARVPAGFIRDVFAVMADTPQHTYQVLTKRPRRAAGLCLAWPPNVWLGVSVESDRYTWRAQTLADIPAAVRFISAEPLLGPLPSLNLTRIDWVIIGGESGQGARPMDPEWAREIVRKCRASGAAPFVKQLGAVTGRATGAGPKGSNWDRWPDDLKVREFPRSPGPRGYAATGVVTQQ